MYVCIYIYIYICIYVTTSCIVYVRAIRLLSCFDVYGSLCFLLSSTPGLHNKIPA